MRDIVVPMSDNTSISVILGLAPRIARRSVALDVVHGRDSRSRRATAPDLRVKLEDDGRAETP